MIVLFVVALVGGVQAAVDLTVTEKATGSVVVNAVVDIISQSCVFDNDRLMLRRIAYAETRDGTASYTFTNGGGIWQVDEQSFDTVQSSLSPALRDDIRDKFGIDWNLPHYRDLTKPLYSAIAAMLKITSHYINRLQNIPQSVDDQARYWSSSYTVNTWSDAVEVYQKASAALANSCSSPKVDVIFVVDSSGSIKISNFIKVKLFLGIVANSFQIGNETVRVGLIQFSDESVVEFDLRRYSSKADVSTAIEALPYYRGNTNTAAALYNTTDMIKRQGRHDDGVPVVVVFLTDGKSNVNKYLTVPAAEYLHAELPKVTVFAVGVGTSIVQSELTAIASEPKCNNVYYLADFDDITSFTDQIMNGACKAQAELEEGRQFNGIVEKDQHYYFQIGAKRDRNGVRVHVTARSGAVRAYYSWKVQNPNDALHDVMVDVDADEQTEDVHIGWNDEAEKNAVDVPISEDTNQTTRVAPLYGAVVGVKRGQNEFTLYYTDSAQQQNGHLLLLFTALIMLTSNYF